MAWTIIGPVIKKRETPRGFRKYALCRCDCGKEKLVNIRKLARGETNSCGCQRKNRLTHGKSYSSEYVSWQRMLARCYYPKNNRYEYYNGRVQVCDRWRFSFEAFYADMGDKPSASHSLDRIDNNGDYSPENCRWATNVQQARNSRKNRLLSFNGKTQCLQAWSDETGIKRTTITQRLDAYGWEVEKALTTPTLNGGIN